MSKIALSGNASGTGTFTLAAPNSNSDRTLNLPDEAGTVLTSASTVASSQITGALNATGSAPIYAARAWVNFNGTGTVAIRGSGNVSSITDEGTGQYAINFTTAMPDSNYSFVLDNNGVPYGALTAAPSTTQLRRYYTNAAGNAYVDQEYVLVAIFR